METLEQTCARLTQENARYRHEVAMLREALRVAAEDRLTVNHPRATRFAVRELAEQYLALAYVRGAARTSEMRRQFEATPDARPFSALEPPGPPVP